MYNISILIFSGFFFQKTATAIRALGRIAAGLKQDSATTSGSSTCEETDSILPSQKSSRNVDHDSPINQRKNLQTPTRTSIDPENTATNKPPPKKAEIMNSCPAKGDLNSPVKTAPPDNIEIQNTPPSRGHLYKNDSNDVTPTEKTPPETLQARNTTPNRGHLYRDISSNLTSPKSDTNPEKKKSFLDSEVPKGRTIFGTTLKPVRSNTSELRINTTSKVVERNKLFSGHAIASPKNPDTRSSLKQNFVRQASLKFDELDSKKQSSTVTKKEVKKTYPEMDSVKQKTPTLVKMDSVENKTLKNDTKDTLKPISPRTRVAGKTARFSKKMVDSESFRGDIVRFDVTVTGDPEPELSWFQDGELIREDARHIITYSKNGVCSLIIKSVTEDDEGEYSCEVSNSFGQTSCSAELIICGLGAF